MIPRRKDTGLHNWRTHPHSQWAFQNVRELVPTASLPGVQNISVDTATLQNFDAMQFDSPDGKVSLQALGAFSHSDAIVVLHEGKQVLQWAAPYCDPTQPHIIFSISKSLTAMIAGVLQDQGEIDFDQQVVHYLPDAKPGAYGDCSLRQVLDMTVSLNFEENYTDPESEYMRYREATAWNPTDQKSPGPDLEYFLYSLSKAAHPHGEAFAYRSPNSDLLGLVLERVAGKPLAELYSELLWKPLGLQTGYVTVDRKGLARAAGGICLTALDLAKIGQLFLDRGMANDKQVISEDWINDTCTNGSREAWDRGNYKARMPNGKYRNKWYQNGDTDKTMCGRGIHGQLLYINPKRSVVISRLSSHPDPLNDVATDTMMDAFKDIASAIG